MKKILIILFLFVFIRVNASIVVMDADSGRVLYEKNMNEKKLIASTTKIMTSIIALENGNLNDEYVVGDEIKKVNGSMIYVKEGEKFTLNDLLHGLLLQSGNDAAMIIAKNVMSYDEFIGQMNMKAFKLGMYNTIFENPHGLNDDTKNYSTAYDMALLMKYSINNKEFIRISRDEIYKVNNYIWYNKNKLLNDYKYLTSGKIGYTKASGPVFVSAASKNNKKLIVVSINESDKFELHKKLYEKYFNLYDRYKIIDKNTFSFNIKDDDYNYYFIKDDVYMLLKKDEIDKIKIKVNINDVFNNVEIYLDNKLIDSKKIYKVLYNERKNKIKELLSF